MSAFDNQPLWHERDISHSSVERVIIPDSTTLANYLLRLLVRIIKDLNVYPDNMKENINKTKGLTFSQRILLELIDRGYTREEAYDLVQRNAMLTWESGEEFYQVLKEDDEIKKNFTSEELKEFFDVTYYTRNIDKVYKRLGL